MEKINFKNYEDSPTTPINAQALNKMQDNIEEAIADVEVDVDFTELENAIDNKADKSNTYTKAEVDTELEGKVDKKLPPRTETTNLNFDKTEEEWGSVRYDIVTSQVTQGKPMGNGFVTTYFWDNSGKFDSQLYIPNNDSRRPQWRSRSNKDEWGEWINLEQEKNILQLAVEGNRVLGSSPRTINNWVENNKIGNKLTATSTGVRIGAGASMIKVSAYAAYRHLASSGAIVTPYLLLEKNGNLYKRFLYNKVDAALQSVAMIIPDFIMPVSEGDVIGLSVGAGSTSRYDSGTYLTVEVIE